MHNQKVLNHVATKLMLHDGDDSFFNMLDELQEIAMGLPPSKWKKALKNVAKAYGLEVPGCLE